MALSIKQVALRTIELETSSVAGLAAYINDDFEKPFWVTLWEGSVEKNIATSRVFSPQIKFIK